MKLTIAALLIALAPGCPPTPNPPDPPPPSFDAGQDDCAKACANLAKIGCPEGRDPTCAIVCRDTNGKLANIRPSCLEAAQTPSMARECGTVRCMP